MTWLNVADLLQVIDEIDGALGDGKGTVDVILKMVLPVVCSIFCIQTAIKEFW